MKVKICSACLLGIKCRWDGKSNFNKKLVRLAKKYILIPVCPEQLGGLSTPREPAEKRGGKFFTKSGKDVTKNYIKGANEVLKIAKLFNVKEAILKQKSPACGCGEIYDGSFRNRLIKGDGIVAKVLKKHKIKVITEKDL